MRRVRVILVLIALTLVSPGCQTLREIANLRLVNFSIDRVADARLAGVELSRIRSFNDLSAIDVARLTAAVASGNVPLRFVLHLAGENPEENGVQARLVKMDWTLFLEDRETISGAFDDEVLLPPGQVTDIPITIQLDLVDFFDRNASDLVELALAVTGRGGNPTNVKLQATPTIDTSLGPIRYPRPITIVSEEVGG